MIKNHTLYDKSGSLVAGCLFVCTSLYTSLAQAEFSIGALAGLAEHNTIVHGDLIYATAPANYFQNPSNIHTDDFGGGFTGRYLRAFNPRLSFGVEAGYIFLTQNNTVNRADDLLPNPTWVENFTTKSNGIVLANVVANYSLIPTVSFSIFGGPAWLNTNYTANDFVNGVVHKAASNYQITGDLGAETAWTFNPNWAVGMRFDFIFDTNYRTVATTGAFGDALFVNNTAKSSVTLFSLTLKYIIPENMGSSSTEK